MADEKNQNDAVQDVLARLRRQMNELDEAYGSGSLASSPDEENGGARKTDPLADLLLQSIDSETVSTEEVPLEELREAPDEEILAVTAENVDEPLNAVVADDVGEYAEEETEEEIEEETEEQIEEETEEETEEEAEEEIEEETEESADAVTQEADAPLSESADESVEEAPAAVTVVEQIGIFDEIDENDALSEELPLDAESIEEDLTEDDLPDADDIPVFVREAAPSYIRKAQIMPEAAEEVSPLPFSPIVTEETVAPPPAPSEEAEEREASALGEDHASVFVPNGKAEVRPRIAADSIFSPERRFDPSRYDAMLADYEKAKTENRTPSEPVTQMQGSPIGRPVLNPVPEMPLAFYTPPSEEDAEEEEQEEECAPFATDELTPAEDLAAALIAAEEVAPRVAAEETVTQEAEASAPAEPLPVSDRVVEADPSLRENTPASREIPFSDRVQIAPREYRVDDDYVRDTRPPRTDDGEDFMSELPESIRAPLVGAPLGRPNRVVNLREEYSETAEKPVKKKRVKRTRFHEERVDKNEEVSRHQLNARLKQEIGQTRVRLLVIAILSFVLLLLENIPYVSLLPEGFVEENTAGILDALLLLGVAAAAWPRLSVGFDGIRIGRILPESILLIETALAFIYSVVFGILRSDVGYFSFVPALGICILYAFLSFRYETKRHVLDKAEAIEDKLLLSPIDAKTGAGETRAIRELTDEEDHGIYRIRRVKTADGIARRLARVCEDEGLNFALLIALLVAFVASLLITFFVRGSLVLAVESALFSSFVTVPVAMMCGAHAFPMCRADKAAGEDAFLAGETTVYEATAVRAISFEDVAAAPAAGVKLSGVRVYCNDPTTVFKYLTALYNHIGGPLCGRFSGMYSQKRHTSLVVVRLVDATENGVSAEIDGAEVVVGNGQHMLAYGITPAYDAADERVLPAGKCGVLYVAINGMICMKFYVEHGISPGFVHDVKRLHRLHIAAILRTYDPNLNEKTIAHSALRGMPVAIVSKKKDECADHTVEHAPGGIACDGKKNKLLPLLLLCFRVRDALRVGWIYKLVGAVLGGGGAIALSVLGLAGVLPSAYAALYQLILLGGYLLYVRLYIKLPDMTKDK